MPNIAQWGMAIALSLGAAAPGPVQAQALPAVSAYTKIDLDQCTVLDADDFKASWACPGYKGLPVRITETDLRFAITYGFGAALDGQSVPPFNRLDETLEWRLKSQVGRLTPFATIVRYFVRTEAEDASGSGQAEGQVLVVTQLKDGAICPIAYVDALANADADTLAQKAADENAGHFDCTRKPEIVGTFKAWPQTAN